MSAVPVGTGVLPHEIRLFYRAADGETRTDLGPSELAAAVQSESGILWLDLDLRDRHQHALLENVFHFHPLSIEDTLNPESRVKLEEYPNYLFAIIRGVRFEETTEDPYDLETFNINFFLGRNYLVTVRSTHSGACDAMAGAVARNPDLLTRGPDRLMHHIMDAAVDEFFPVLDRVDDFVDGLEERVFVQFDDRALREIFAVKRLTLGLRRHLVPQRDVFNTLSNRPNPLLRPETQLYFRDIYDHVLRLTDTLDNYRELMSSTLDSYLSQVSNRLGAITKALSMVATITLPFVVMSGMWGMNFTRIPLSGHPHGFAILIVVQVAIAAGLVAFLRWRKLL